MPTEIWSRFRFRLNGFQVQPTTQYIDQFRVWIAALLQQIHSLSAFGDGDRHAGLECSSLSRTAGGMRFGLLMISRSSRDLPSFRI